MGRAGLHIGLAANGRRRGLAPRRGISSSLAWEALSPIAILSSAPPLPQKPPHTALTQPGCATLEAPPRSKCRSRARKPSESAFAGWKAAHGGRQRAEKGPCRRSAPAPAAAAAPPVSTRGRRACPHQQKCPAWHTGHTSPSKGKLCATIYGIFYASSDSLQVAVAPPFPAHQQQLAAMFRGASYTSDEDDGWLDSVESLKAASASLTLHASASASLLLPCGLLPEELAELEGSAMASTFNGGRREVREGREGRRAGCHHACGGPPTGLPHCWPCQRPPRSLPHPFPRLPPPLGLAGMEGCTPACRPPARLPARPTARLHCACLRPALPSSSPPAAPFPPSHPPPPAPPQSRLQRRQAAR